MSEASQVVAAAHPNIALVKYWGKAALAGNVPAVGSLSITLDSLVTRTRLRRLPAEAAADEVLINGVADDAQTRRTTGFLDLVRQRAGASTRFEVVSENNFPTAAGLASSASGFAALTLAAARALGIDGDMAVLADLARQGSGSACRSLFGGFVAWRERQVTQVADADHWPLGVAVAVVSEAVKAVGSGDGMERSRMTSPFYPAWVAGQDEDLQAARQAVLARDFARLAEVAEFSCLKMHGLAMASRPGLLYWQAPTLALMQRVRALRESGVPVFFTVDAGPQVKAVCLPEALSRVAAALAEVPGVLGVHEAGLGGGAWIESAADV